MEATWIDDIEEAAVRRFPRWAPQTWSALLEGPARELVEALDATERPTDSTRPVLETYLKLAAEAVGLGYLYPVEDAGRPNFFSLAWFDLLPRRLAPLEPRRQMEVLSTCWNLGENLETRAAWFQTLFLELIAGDAGDDIGLETFEDDVRRVTASILESPAVELGGGDHELRWISVAGEDGRFLPGRVDYVAPRVAVVYHRHGGLDGGPKSGKVVWLGAKPKVLGAADDELLRQWQSDADDEADDDGGDHWKWKRLRKEDPRLTRIQDSARNRWRAVCTLVTSQFLVVAYPASVAGERSDCADSSTPAEERM